MTRGKTTVLFLTSAAIASSLSYGQEAPATPETGSQLAEVLVTAQKRVERLRDIPVSASVVSSDSVASANAGDISDLNKLVPSVNINGSLNGRVPMGIRGISSVSNEGTVGLSSGVAILIDGVPVPSDSVSGNQLEDIQGIEVLKGPQATLGGRTAASGVVNIVTRKPMSAFSADVSATATDDNEYRGNLFVTGPIRDGLAFSLSAYANERDYPIRNTQLNRDTSQSASGARAKLLYQPTDNLDITLSARYALTKSDGANLIYTYLSPGTTLLVGTGGPPFMSPAVLLPGITPSLDNDRYASPIQGSTRAEDHDASLDIEYRIGDLTFGSITAFQHEQQDNTQDLFAVASYFWNDLTGAPASGAPPFYNVQNLKENINQFSQEFRLASPADKTFSYLVGLFYSDTKVRLQETRNLLPAFNNVDVTPETATYDIYARTTWKLAPQTSLTTGLRYNYDELSYRDYQALYTFSFPPPVVLPDQFASDSSNSSTVVGDISLQQRFGSDSMAYATYARGYSPGAYNTAQAIDTTGTTTSLPKLALVSKETVDHFEVGVKSGLLDGRATLNVSVFDTKYKNFQIQNFDLSSTAFNPPLILEAAGAAETRGLEIDTRWAATQTLRLGLSAAFVDAKFTDYPDAPCYYPTTTGGTVAGCTYVNGTGVQDLKGKRLPNSPRFKGNLDVEQRVPVQGYDLLLNASYSYRSSAQMLADQNPQAVLPSFGILNLNVGLGSPSGKYRVTVFANNVFDKHYLVDVEDFWSAPWGGTNTVIAQPARDAKRYFGVRLNASF